MKEPENMTDDELKQEIQEISGNSENKKELERELEVSREVIERGLKDW